MISPEISIKGSKTMPAVSFKNGKLNIIGRAIPPCSKDWFEPLLQTMYAYSLEPKDETEINIQLDYLNSDSNRALMNLLVLAESMYSSGKKVTVRWHYQNNDAVMYDQGSIFKSLVDLPFTFEPMD